MHPFGSAGLAVTHLFAVEASLYWYYWWFDIVMHFWGGMLLGVGLHILASFSLWRFTPNVWQVCLGMASVIIAWEVFEYVVGLYDPNSYVVDVAKDVVVGFSGGLLAHVALINRYNGTHE